MTSILDSVNAAYRGRLPSRADGKARRRKILDAAHQIIIRQGVQGVKHRAVAEEADVPLAATTYYFPDIHALLHDAFLDFYERNIYQLQALESQGNQFISSLREESPVKTGKLDVSQVLTDLIFQHIQAQVANRDDRIIERAFRNESIRNEQMANLVNSMELQQLKAIEEFFRALKSENPESDSRELMGLILFLEHSLLARYVCEKEAKITIARFFKRIL
ncbi:TetR/AcrR family transcriptional regulator [Aliikangiella sp. G2MR2-5]|uniref:TetR/AcrR family transcriptional regulator n=1 Tax=Aliikangiella sp. G2MR2-5 TaxID=2788943 RepID=UPI0018AA42DC|nr:TetR family transcriptional regulator [Aliikangiella sp. G2MR2-5]